MLQSRSEISFDLAKDFFAASIKSFIRFSGVNCSQGRSTLFAVNASKINSVELLRSSVDCSLLSATLIWRIKIASAPANSL